MNLPTIGISMGDPFGNGSEITVKALSNEEMYKYCRPVIIGDAACIEHAAKIAKTVSNIYVGINRIEKISDAKFEPGCIDVLDMNIVSDKDIPVASRNGSAFGIGPTVLGGEASFRYIEKLIELAKSGEVDATVTNAISKEAINMAGHHFSGHTEIYAELTNCKKYCMMLADEGLRVAHISTHVSLRDACDRVKTQRVLDVIRMANECCKDFGIVRPAIAVAGLNPHCGESGLFGSEEIEQIQPAIEQAIAENIYIPDGKPLPPDSVFSKAVGGWYDVVVVMYHDQGHIPLKVRGFVYDKKQKNWEAVKGINITLGLPIIRVSVDHGTGFGHAGSGTANELSLVNAISCAANLASARKGKLDV